MPATLRLLLIAGLAPLAALAATYADEDRDWGVAPTTEIRGAPYSAPTPKDIPGARVILTDQLKSLLERSTPVLVDVAAGEDHLTLRGALWLPGAGRGSNFVDVLQGDLADLLDKLTQGDKTAPVVFFCVNAQCWLSYNASLRAAVLGYREVYWYRGGIEAWRAAGLPLTKVLKPGTRAPQD